RYFFKMVEDKSGKSEWLLLKLEAKLLPESFLHGEAVYRRECSFAGHLNLISSSRSSISKRAAGSVEHPKVIGAGESSLVGYAILDVGACKGLRKVGELR